MSDVVIKAEGLGKKYLIGHEVKQERYTALRDVIARQAKGLARSARDLFSGRPTTAGDEIEEFWALRDVDFEIRHGDVVGIIGRNGAGKSTLLKILSRITEPTEGRVTIRGRVASLLEVGTGFHPELTGRENIYLNGAILGMRRDEIRRKFEEIVDFAGVEKFLDTPVKRYSSGMYVRLAFAVAAHLEPEILVVDEVLAVGDADFQKKCLSKMQDVSAHGRTVLFVSHNLSAIQSLCSSGILLTEGRIGSHGPIQRTVAEYASGGNTRRARRTTSSRKDVQVEEVQSSLEVDPTENKRLLRVEIVLSVLNDIRVNIDLRIADIHGAPVAVASLGNQQIETPLALKRGENKIELVLDVKMIVVGRYSLAVDVSKPFSHYFDRYDDALKFDIETQHWFDAIQPTRQEWAVGCVQLPLWQEQQTRSDDPLTGEKYLPDFGR